MHTISCIIPQYRSVGVNPHNCLQYGDTHPSIATCFPKILSWIFSTKFPIAICILFWLTLIMLLFLRILWRNGRRYQVKMSKRKYVHSSTIFVLRPEYSIWPATMVFIIKDYWSNVSMGNYFSSRRKGIETMHDILHHIMARCLYRSKV